MSINIVEHVFPVQFAFTSDDVKLIEEPNADRGFRWPLSGSQPCRAINEAPYKRPTGISWPSRIKLSSSARYCSCDVAGERGDRQAIDQIGRASCRERP